MMMKKRVAFLILACAILFSSCTSAELVGTETEETAESAASFTTSVSAEEAKTYDKTGFQAGWAREDITPTSSVPLGGYGNTSYRMSKTVQERLYATCIALREGEKTVLLYTLDIIRCPESLYQMAAELIGRKTGVPADQIYLSCTHTHSGPDVSSVGEGALDAWKAIFYRAVVKCGEEAIADLDRTEVYAGSVKTENMTYVRRYILQDGTGLGANYGESTPENPIVSHESEADEMMQIVRFNRVNGKDIVLANFQSHPTATGGSTRTELSADFVAPFRREVEKEGDVLCAYYSGALGNLVMSGRLEGEVKSSEVEYRVYGKKLAGVCLSALPDLKKMETGPIHTTKTLCTGKVNHTTDSLAPLCADIVSAWNSNDRELASALCKEKGISGYYAASSITNRVNMPETKDFTIYALSFGEIGIITCPYEMFCNSGMQVKEASPFAMTLIFGAYTNGYQHYFPTELAWNYGGYEPDTSTYERGTAEQTVAHHLENLNRLYTEAQGDK